MQQTETYKLKLIETDDPFSPTPLNENAEALETELTRMDAVLTRLDAAVLHLAYGTYKGNGSTLLISLGFTPKAVCIFSESGTTFIAAAMKGYPATYSTTNILELVTNGFRVVSNPQIGTNSSNGSRRYVAIG